MSKYLVFSDVVFPNRELLIAALQRLGYSVFEEGDRLPLYGYRGDVRPETAELVIRRRYVGPSSNDIGFAKTERGYVPILSEYDQRVLRQGRFLVDLRQAYSEQVVEELRRRLNGTLQRSVEHNVVKLRLRY